MSVFTIKLLLHTFTGIPFAQSTCRAYSVCALLLWCHARAQTLIGQ